MFWRIIKREIGLLTSRPMWIVGIIAVPVFMALFFLSLLGEGLPKDFQLDEMKEIVGGYIELVDLRDGRLLVINEEGKLYKLEVNLAATTMAHAARAIADWDVIVGNVLLCNSDQIK